jgi:tRNA wybutosine-synthesizing protein 1
MIVEEAVELHRRLIKQLRGMPGVKPERLVEAMTVSTAPHSANAQSWHATPLSPPLPCGFQVRHCALSLVGEPIMYPRINELVRHLHSRAISTFL